MVSKLLYSLFILTTLSLTLPRPAHALTRYQDLLYQDLSIQRNLVYGQAISPITHQSETLRLDLYQPAGDVTPNTELTINSPYVTGQTLVYLTPTGNSDNKVLFVKSKADGSFIVAIDSPATTDIPFNWWIIQLQSFATL